MKQHSDASDHKRSRTGTWIAVGLVMGVLTGLFFGEYCEPLELIGRAYVGLLQMTVLPYLVLSLVGKMGRLNPQQARMLGVVAVGVMLLLWLIGIILIVVLSSMLPPIDGASFFNPVHEHITYSQESFLSNYIPTNIFHALSREYVPAVVLFCLCLGSALMLVPGKERLIDLLDLCSAGITRINVLLVRLAPVGLFTLTAAAAGTLEVDELSRLQAYVLLFTIACGVAAFAALPLLASSLTHVGYRKLLKASGEPMLIAIATGKLFVALPQIAEKCEELIHEDELARQAEEAGSEPRDESLQESTVSVLVPLAYPFPHIGKLFAFLFISFAAWYAGQSLTTGQTASMATTGVVSSFASPLITIPYMLDRYHLPQDLMTLFILPGFLTTRLADLVGVMHLMVLSVVVTSVLQGRYRLRLKRLVISIVSMAVCLAIAVVVSRAYLASTTFAYDLDQRFLSLEINSPHEDVAVYAPGETIPPRQVNGRSTLDRIRSDRVIRVGYHPDHLPYSFFNKKGHLVGYDVELMHQLANRLDVRLEFVPYQYGTLVDDLQSGAVDVGVGGVMMNPSRLLEAGFSRPYQTVTLSVVTPDFKRAEFDLWNDPHRRAGSKLGVVQEDLAGVARRELENTEVVVVESMRAYFDGRYPDLDGLLVPAEEGAAWNVLHPKHTVMVPEPQLQRPVCMVVRPDDAEWLTFINRWLDFEELDGNPARLRGYWVEGGGTKERPPRWCIARDVLGWLP